LLITTFNQYTMFFIFLLLLGSRFAKILFDLFEVRQYKDNRLAILMSTSFAENSKLPETESRHRIFCKLNNTAMG